MHLLLASHINFKSFLIVLIYEQKLFLFIQAWDILLITYIYICLCLYIFLNDALKNCMSIAFQVFQKQKFSSSAWGLSFRLSSMFSKTFL